MSFKANRTRPLRYKRPALASMGYDSIVTELDEIYSACQDIQYYVDDDDGTLLNALDGDDEAEWEFKMAFSDLSAKAERLYEHVYEEVRYQGHDGFERVFNDCTVALIGDRYRIIGWDYEEEDYFSLTSYDEKLAFTEAGKRLMRRTKAEIISTVGQCLGILVSYLDVRQQYDYLKATMDILRDENTSLLKNIKAIDRAYQDAESVGFYPWYQEVERFDALLNCLPDRAWLE